MDIQRMCALIDERKDELFELLSSLIKINSENFRSHGNEEEIAGYVHKLCVDAGLESDIYTPLDIDGFKSHPDYMPGRHLENRYNVTARWKGKCDTDDLMLMAHLDTVEVGDLSNWEDDPLSGKISDGKIFGRGACDDKYALATSLFIIKLLKENGFIPEKNILFSAYCDEEHGGSHGALASVLKYPCRRIISMDCKQDVLWHCGSGGGGLIYSYHTAKTVDSAKNTALAIPVIIEEIEKFGDRRRKELSENRFYRGSIIPDTALRYMGARAGNSGMDLGMGEISFTYYTDRTKEEIDAELAEVAQILEKRLAPLGIISDGFRPRTRFFHYVFCEPDSKDVTDMLDAIKSVDGKEPVVCGSCLSDMSVISKYGSDRVFAFGIGRDFSDEGGAHQPNEFIECDRLVEFTKSIAAYILKTL